MNRLIILIAPVLVALFAVAGEYSPEEVPNVHLRSANEFVSDPDNLVSPDTKARINARLKALMDSTTAEVAVVVLESIGDYDAFDFARELGDSWKVGKKDKSNGLILLMAIEQREVRIYTGYGLEGVIPDAVADKIIRGYIIPAMRDDDLDRALDSSTEALSKIILDPKNADEVMSKLPNDRKKAPIDGDAILKVLTIVGACIFIFALVLFCVDIANLRRKSNYDRSIALRKRKTTYWILAVLSLGGALPFALIILWLSKIYRNRPVKCDTCGAKMHRLGEEEDNELLSAGQDLEERLNTVDYDVWECPECGTVERFPFRIDQKEYTECGRCHTIAKHEICDKIIVQPTVRSEGIGEKIYRCEYCGDEKRWRYKIPRKEDPAAALAAGAVLGSMAGRGGGGGFSGGSWGGGGFGGGGAGGRW